MNEIIQFAQSVCEVRKTICGATFSKPFTPEDAARKVLEIFNVSNSLFSNNEMSELIKKVKICKVKRNRNSFQDHLWIFAGMDSDSNLEFYGYQNFKNRYSKLSESLKTSIPVEMFESIYEFFVKNLSDYFDAEIIEDDIVTDSDLSIVITMKD